MTKTIDCVLRTLRDKLANIDEADLVLSVLSAHTFGQSASWLQAHRDELITTSQEKRLVAVVERAAKGEPLAYIVGRKEFYGRDFWVNRDVLIPRPESENIIFRVDDFLFDNAFYPTDNQDITIVDVGTGSGCLAITLALEYPRASVYAIDTSPAALNVARANAQTLAAQHVVFLSGSLLGPLSGVIAPGSVDIIVANLPYISDFEYRSLPHNVKDFEPRMALYGGPTGQELNQALIAQAPFWLKPHGYFIYETTNGALVSPNLSR